ncbi:hypothetical protein K2O51_31795 (plasmid) [Cupriavidus pinatubonensis]|uniref:hypothetical protein n=1 Tax=Cupriavidus pinatubonensis TaxID=248026 RepID=UPI001C73A0D2|nr:hypothetical protein [Cupriavidus pinatubonensis]QYY33610.1 hypothetical protein K2O51_31795 [Cupriavidus pinatubonensis]
MDPSISFQVGNLIEIDPADPEYPNLAQAAARAAQLSALRPASGFGIWTGPTHGGKLMAIAYAGDLFWNEQVSPTTLDCPFQSTQEQEKQACIAD